MLSRNYLEQSRKQKLVFNIKISIYCDDSANCLKNIDFYPKRETISGHPNLQESYDIKEKDCLKNEDFWCGYQKDSESKISSR